ncbi:phage tail terminator-like protein [Orrella sp. JC864]|uniref:phage tail terminator-like protein n=1 Tax=Orrella sp. JC864 TaxID=3120298 RepID=UPI00300B2414
MTYEEIRQAIVGRMAAFSGLEQSRIAYPNHPGIFAPPDEGLWCRLSIQPGPAFMAGMADRPYTRKPGLIVVQCFARERTGIKPLTELADALEVHFAYWRHGELECLEASHVDVGPADGFYQQNVRVAYRAG